MGRREALSKGQRAAPWHGGNRGSNPLGDAIYAIYAIKSYHFNTIFPLGQAAPDAAQW